jgi:hypothetical protein
LAPNCRLPRCSDFDSYWDQLTIAGAAAKLGRADEVIE